jgi:hypothetical protein
MNDGDTGGFRAVAEGNKRGVTKTKTTIKPTITSYCQLARGYSHRTALQAFMTSV